MTGTRNGVATSGTWVGDVNNGTIQAEFPGAGDPLKKMNGLWKLIDTDWDYANAEMTTPAGKNILHLRKKP